MISVYKNKFLKFYEKNERKVDFSFFLGGFVFDIFTLSQIDDPLAITQQVAYILILGFFFYKNFLFEKSQYQPSGVLAKIWDYRNLIMHFVLGSLLSVYSLLFLKSSSIFSSIVFVAVLLILMTINEFKSVQQGGINLKIGLYVICVFAFFSLLVPVVLGFVGWIPFTIALSLTLLFFGIFFKLLENKTHLKSELYKSLLAPCVGVLLVLLLFYSMGWIPPVPISIQQMGIYHQIEVQNGQYTVRYERPFWKFWQAGAQDFNAEPNDQIVFFVQIFSPKRFSDQVFLKWSQNTPGLGWQTSDRIPIRIVGGRKEGFRGYAIKKNYSDGDWRVQVETTNGHEIGRLHFTVTKSTITNSEREWRVESF